MKNLFVILNLLTITLILEPVALASDSESSSESTSSTSSGETSSVSGGPIENYNESGSAVCGAGSSIKEHSNYFEIVCDDIGWRVDVAKTNESCTAVLSNAMNKGIGATLIITGPQQYWGKDSNDYHYESMYPQEDADSPCTETNDSRESFFKKTQT